MDNSQSADPCPERLCPSCKLNTLRRGEKHHECFDCLGHGPKDFGNLRCDLCRSWRISHFEAATAKYVDSSSAKQDALELSRTAKASQGGSAEMADPGLAEAAPVSTPAPGGSQEALTASILAVMKSLGWAPPSQGPCVPGPSGRLGVGVPSGATPSLGHPSVVLPKPLPDPSSLRRPRRFLVRGRETPWLPLSWRTSLCWRTYLRLCPPFPPNLFSCGFGEGEEAN